jgi:hypothetical protein
VARRSRPPIRIDPARCPSGDACAACTHFAYKFFLLTYAYDRAT